MQGLFQEIIARDVITNGQHTPIRRLSRRSHDQSITTVFLPSLRKFRDDRSTVHPTCKEIPYLNDNFDNPTIR
jgi:hypothetical protein